MDYVERFVRRVRGCAADEGAAVFGKYTIRAGEVCAVVGLARGGGRGPRRNAQERRYYTVFDSLKLILTPMLNPIGSNGRRTGISMRCVRRAGRALPLSLTHVPNKELSHSQLSLTSRPHVSKTPTGRSHHSRQSSRLCRAALRHSVYTLYSNTIGYDSVFLAQQDTVSP